MYRLRALSALVLCCAGCLTGRTRSEYDALVRETREAERGRPRAAAPKPTSADEETLASAADLGAILRFVLARNPDLAETRERVQAALARVPAAARLPDLEFKYEQWAVPLARPYALNEAQTLMFGFRQTFPAPGSLAAKSRQLLEEAKIAGDTEQTRALDLAQQARHAFFDFYRADREYKVHLEHVALATQMVELAREHYQAGHGTQQDVLRAIVDLSRLHEDIATIEQQLASSRALLNALMARPIDAALGAPSELSDQIAEVRAAELERALVRRPELASAERAIRRSQAALDAAKATANLPQFMVGADYWYQPTAAAPTPAHAYAAMVAITLPWLNPAHREDARAAEHALAADRRALESVRNTTQFQLRDAVAKLEAARYSFRIIDHDLLPQAIQSFESARAAYSSNAAGDALGLIDALRSLLQVRLDRARAVARMHASLADVERAAGIAAGQAADRGQP